MKNILIHIGKCGGSTCRIAVANSEIKIDEFIHIRQPRFYSDAKYFIIARNPISRAVSAFNWRRHLVNSNAWQKDRFPGEKEIIDRYMTMSGLAEALYFEDGTDNVLAQGNFRSIHHLGESISFYLTNLLKVISPDQIFGVVMQEILDDDLFRVFGVKTDVRYNGHSDKAPSEMLHLSQAAISNLNRFLKQDFMCLDQLRSWGLINPLCPDEQYQELLSDTQITHKS